MAGKTEVKKNAATREQVTATRDKRAGRATR